MINKRRLPGSWLMSCATQGVRQPLCALGRRLSNGNDEDAATSPMLVEVISGCQPRVHIRINCVVKKNNSHSLGPSQTYWLRIFESRRLSFFVFRKFPLMVPSFGPKQSDTLCRVSALTLLVPSTLCPSWPRPGYRVALRIQMTEQQIGGFFIVLV